MTEPIITSGVIITFLGVLGLWAKVLLNYMSKKKNVEKGNSGNPGNHGERIATLEEAVLNIKDDIEKIDEKLEKMRRPGK